MYDMTVNRQLAVVFYHSPCCIIFCTKFFFYILSCIECIHISWCTTVQNKSIIIIIILASSRVEHIDDPLYHDVVSSGGCERSQAHRFGLRVEQL